MNDLAYILLKVLIVVLGSLFIKWTVDNYKEKHYFMFGFNLFCAVDEIIILALLHLTRFEVITL
jgi:hypothetical protein